MGAAASRCVKVLDRLQLATTHGDGGLDESGANQERATSSFRNASVASSRVAGSGGNVESSICR